MTDLPENESVTADREGVVYVYVRHRTNAARNDLAREAAPNDSGSFSENGNSMEVF